MNLDFDLEHIVTTEFGVGETTEGNRDFVSVPVDLQVQEVLAELARSTSGSIDQDKMSAPHFDPAEKYANREYVVLPLDSDLAAPLTEFHRTDKLDLVTPQLDRLRQSFCYFSRFTDTQNRRLTALRRASQFKAIIGKQNRLISLVADTLRTIQDPVFQLNADFDVLVDSELIHIVHPESFRILSQIDAAIAEAVPRNIQSIQTSLPYVDWVDIEKYGIGHSRAAGLLASIRTRRYADNLNRDAFIALCRKTGVEVDASQNQVVIPEGQVMAFLEVLDRRRYEVNLVSDRPEQYRASSRERLGGQS